MRKIGELFGRVGAFLSTNLYGVLAVLIIMTAIVGYAVVFSSSIGPALTNQGVVKVQLENVKKTLVVARQVQEEPVEGIRTRAAQALATRSAYEGTFFAESDTAQLVDALYQYAAASGVTIVDIQSAVTSTQPTLIPMTVTPVRPTAPPPTPTGPTPTLRPGTTAVPTTAPATAAATPVPPPPAPVGPEAFTVKPIRVFAQGPSRQLVEFTSRIREAYKSLVVTNLAITGGDSRAASLVMDLSLYVSALGGGGTAPGNQSVQVSMGIGSPTAPVPPPQVLVPPMPTGPAAPPINPPVQPPAQKASPAATMVAPIVLPPPPGSLVAVPVVPTAGNAGSRPVPTVVPPTLTPAAVKGLQIAIQASGSAVSLPYTFFTASTLMAAINAQGGSVTQVDRWTGTDWQSYSGKGSTDFKIQAGFGFVVRTGKASTWMAPAMLGAAPGSLHLDAGWWLIGVLPCKDGSGSCLTASTFAKAINDQGGGVTQISDLQNGQWIVHNVGAAANDFQIRVGQAYFVKTTKASDWTP